ncbi:hypothetical protein [Dietzia sp. 179-F 9C3 NHS]|uniref:hypothetical protein n=1 Tax=Dietzia sp. 179-F 9C3 NHS TaxID=3374295 RepID=UPI003879EFE7
MTDPRTSDAPAPDAVRGEAARLSRRLAVARERLAAAPSPRAAGAPARVPTRANAQSARGSDGAGPGARVEGADDEVRALLHPAGDRLARLAALVEALAGGELSEEAAAEAARAVSADQPVRRPR